jgi:hypothetical protein
MARSLAVLALLVVVVLAGCSDDITCPDCEDAPDKPFVSAHVRQRGGDQPSTVATLTVGGDPVPATLVASVNYREFGEETLVDGPLLSATLEDDAVIWQPGTPCTLRVSTDAGFARASAVAPSAPSVWAPATVTLGDSLVVSWSAADDADFYSLRAVLREGVDSLVVEVSVEDTLYVFMPDALTMSGELTGVVASVSGPLPAAGANGNVTGEGWGFFSVSYETDNSRFAATVLEPVKR